MPRTEVEDYTFISERTLAGSGLGTSPELIAGIIDLQRRSVDQTADTGDVAAAAGAAQATGEAAKSSADAAQASADSAGTRADIAQGRADAAYTLANGKVTKSTITSPASYSGTASATYVQAELQAAMDKIASLTTTLQAVVAALKV